jgi:bifunctional non-homologous end joining protein LigD
VAKLRPKALVLDGEFVQSGATGIDFYGLAAKQSKDVSLWAFDLLKLDGKDLRDLPLVERKAQLEMLLKLSKAPAIHFAPSFDDGQASCSPVWSRASRIWPRTHLGQVQDADVAAGQQGSMGADGSKVDGAAE